MLPNFTGMMRSLLPASPVAKALHQAHQMARQHFEHGGVATPARDARGGGAGFVVPLDINPVALPAVVAALRANPSPGTSPQHGYNIVIPGQRR